MLNTTFIGLDVHARTAVAAALNVATGEISEALTAADTTSVTTWVAGFGEDVKVTYEAGPSGYGLALHLLAHNIDCVIAAPSKLLRAPGATSKPIAGMLGAWLGCCRWVRSPQYESPR